MVLSFVALVALANGLLAGVGSWFGYPDLSFQQIVGWLFAPVMFMLNVPWSEAQAAGGLFGTKIVLNEFVAFSQLGPMKQTFSATTVAVVTFALCGFANFSSIAIQVGGIGKIAPSRRQDLAKLGVKALICGTLANYLSATIAGILLWL